MVVLSGYIYGPEDGMPAELAADTLYRSLHALALIKDMTCPILLSGGPSPGAPRSPVGRRHARVLHRSRHRSLALIVENRSSTTHENAVEGAKLLRARGLGRIVLITDAKHMKRAAACFRKEGLEVIPSPCNSFTSKFQNRWDDYLPSPNGAARFQEAVHEWVGLAYYALRGWI